MIHTSTKRKGCNLYLFAKDQGGCAYISPGMKNKVKIAGKNIMYEEQHGREIHYTNNTSELDKIHKSFTHFFSSLHTWLHTKKEATKSKSLFNSQLHLSNCIQTFTNSQGFVKTLRN